MDGCYGFYLEKNLTIQCARFKHEDPNDGEGQTPLQAATRLGDIDCARLLIEARLD